VITYSVESGLTPEQVMDRARQFFGAGGLGLEYDPSVPNCAYFQGGGGYVQVTATREPGRKTEVIVEAREWEHQARDFLQKVR
jgi:hypothetical protein